MRWIRTQSRWAGLPFHALTSLGWVSGSRQRTQSSGGATTHATRRGGAAVMTAGRGRGGLVFYLSPRDRPLGWVRGPPDNGDIPASGRGLSMESLNELRRRRIALGIPLGELARAIGRSDATLSRIERGQIRPSYDLVQKILSYLEGREGLATPHLRAQDVMNRSVVTVDGATELARAAQLLEHGGYSQLPVVESGRVTGALSEAAVLRALARSDGRRARVRDVQEVAYPQVDEEFPADLLAGLLGRYNAVLVLRRGELQGIVTRADLIRGLRGTALRRAGPPANKPVG